MKVSALKGYACFEQGVVTILLALMMVVILFGVVAFAVLIGREMLEALRRGTGDFTLPLLHDAFSGFLMILIGLELMKTIAMYLDDHIVHVEVVFTVAMIAIARHVIDMDYRQAPPQAMLGVGAIIFALTMGYFYFRKAGGADVPEKNEAKAEPAAAL